MENRIENSAISFNFVQGAISSSELTNQLNQFSDLYTVGAYSIFLGQVRKDVINDELVESIEYTANIEMATEQFYLICEEAQKTHAIEKVSILHSLGSVNAGELCLMVIVACGHRKESFVASEYIVERLKKEVPIWGKETFENKSHQWKVNK